MRLLDFFRRTPMPWRGRTPIAAFLRTWDGKADLPDEDPGEKIRWAAGAQDGVFSHHGGGEPDVERAKRIAREVMRAIRFARSEEDTSELQSPPHLVCP